MGFKLPAPAPLRWAWPSGVKGEQSMTNIETDRDPFALARADDTALIEADRRLRDLLPLWEGAGPPTDEDADSLSNAMYEKSRSSIPRHRPRWQCCDQAAGAGRS